MSDGAPGASSLRPTREAWAWLGLVAAVGLLAAATGRGPLLTLLGGLVGIGVLGIVLGALGLRAVEVGRRLPPALFAGRPAAGAWVVRNRSRWFPMGALVVGEADGTAQVEVAWIPPGGEVIVPTSWSFAARGRRRLDTIALASTFPFGLFVRATTRGCVAEVIVAPTPRGGAEVRGADGDGPPGGRPDPGGEFVALRPWRSGDALHHVHWRTSARVGQPMVIVRAAAERARRLVIVEPTRGDAFERALERACGEVLACAPDEEVGLDLCGDIEPPRAGPPWRRHLLDALALARERR